MTSTEGPAPARRLATGSLVASGVLAVAAGVAAAVSGPLADLPTFPVVLIVALSVLAALLALRAFVLGRRAPEALAPAAAGAVAAAFALAAAGALAFLQRDAVLSAGPIGRSLDPALVAWEHGQAAATSRSIALLGLAGLPGLALGLLGLSRVLGRRKAAKAEGAASEAATPAVGARRKALAAAWGALLGAGALGAVGLALDATAIAAPVDAPPHPRLAHLAEVKERLAKADVEGACAELEAALGGGTPRALVEAELPGVVEIAHRCVGHAIEKLPKGMACAAPAAKLASGATVRFAGAEERAKRACDGALSGE